MGVSFKRQAFCKFVILTGVHGGTIAPNGHPWRGDAYHWSGMHPEKSGIVFLGVMRILEPVGSWYVYPHSVVSHL